MMIEDITIEFLKECFILDEARGVLIWKERPDHHFPCGAGAWNARYAGAVAGGLDGRGRVRVKLGGSYYFAHRIIYAIHRGIDLGQIEGLVDHIDCDFTNNVPGNLRAATHSENQCNRRPARGKLSRFKGVYRTSNGGKWFASLAKHGVAYRVGRFETEEEAAAAYRDSALKLHGDFARF